MKKNKTYGWTEIDGNYCLKLKPLVEDARLDEEEQEIWMDRDRWKLLSSTLSSSGRREDR